MGMLEQYDPTEEALINPGEFVYRDAISNHTDFLSYMDDFPAVAVSAFSGAIVDKMVRTCNAAEVAATATANGRVPIHRLEHDGVDMALFLSPVGASASACIMEELIAMGVQKFMYFGACGVLDKTIRAGQIVVPHAAMRDEGTSYHYVPAADEIALDEKNVRVVEKTLEEQGVSPVVAKVWTTDAIYRETRDKAERRKEQGCSVVDMECSALAAVARFRGVSFAEFLFAEDNLDAEEWQPRTLGEQGVPKSDQYIAAALACAAAL